MESEIVMTGLVSVIHVLFAARKTWMRGLDPRIHLLAKEDGLPGQARQ